MQFKGKCQDRQAEGIEVFELGARCHLYHHAVLEIGTEETPAASFDGLPGIGLQGPRGYPRVAAAEKDPAGGVFAEFVEVLGEETVDVRETGFGGDVVENDDGILVLEDLLGLRTADELVGRVVGFLGGYDVRHAGVGREGEVGLQLAQGG